jgi:hypothetical protein
MTTRSSPHDALMDNGTLFRLLKRHDPVAPPTHAFLTSLEADILAKIDEQPRVRVPQKPTDSLMPSWMIHHGWTTRAAAFASVLIIAIGFIVGQVFYGNETASLARAPGLLAFADEPLMDYPSATDTSHGDSDDDAQ